MLGKLLQIIRNLHFYSNMVAMEVIGHHVTIKMSTVLVEVFDSSICDYYCCSGLYQVFQRFVIFKIWGNGFVLAGHCLENLLCGCCGRHFVFCLVFIWHAVTFLGW